MPDTVSAVDKAVLVATNKIRTNPTSFVAKLQQRVTEFSGNVWRPAGSNIGIVTNEGVAAVNEAIAFL